MHSPLMRKLSDLAVGEMIHLEGGEPLMRQATASSRYPKELRGRKFSCRLILAVPFHNPRHNYELVAITRVA